MDSYSFKKKDRVREKKYRQEVGVKTGCNVIVGCYVSLCI